MARAADLQCGCTSHVLTWARLLSGALASTALVMGGISTAAFAQSNNVRITKLQDVNFGALSNLEADAALSQSVCVYAHTANSGYRVTASGSGAGGNFTLSSGTRTLDYQVEWNQLPGQGSGVQLLPNSPLGAQTSSATQQTCNNGPPTSASLILRLLAAALSNASAGSYAGTLTIVIGPE